MPGGLLLASKRRVIFGDTDAMGIVYYGNYFRYFEIGRVELLRKAGIRYRDLTDRGIHLPVIESWCRYISPARYDDELSIFAGIEEVRGARLKFRYLISRDGEKLAEGYTEHAFTNAEGRPVKPPAEVKEKLQEISRGQ
ncbi:MAG: acyl-CoA thioesterase [Deltaproteobacteria bacterium]|nr:MAG: acyl-CoA thioesterase [Deltaproteobacteria bacterium]